MERGIINHVLINLLLYWEWADEDFLLVGRVSLLFLLLLRFWILDGGLQGAPDVWVHQHAEGVFQFIHHF
jgi:hypothetical protein